MSHHDTREVFRRAARLFVREVIDHKRQWDVRLLESYLPEGRKFRQGAIYTGPVTISALVDFMRNESVAQEVVAA